MRRKLIEAVAVLLTILTPGYVKAQSTSLMQTPPEPEYICRSDIFLYIDRSGSLDRFEQRDLALLLAGVLTNTKDIVSDVKITTVIPFAEKVGSAARVSGKNSQNDIARTVFSLFERRPEKLGIGSARQTNLVRVLEDIEKRWAPSSSSAVFIILGDFEHDITDEDKDVDRQVDRDDWERKGVVDLLKRLEKIFKDREGPLLLLLPLESTERSLNIGKKVLDDLEHLTSYDGRAMSVSQFTREKDNILHFLQPLTIESSMVSERGQSYNRIRVRNRSCLSLPPLILRRVKLGQPRQPAEGREQDYLGKSLRFELDSVERKEEEFNFSLGQSVAASSVTLQPLHLPEYRVYVERADAGGGGPYIAEEKINTDEFIFLSQFSGRPTDFNRAFWDPSARFQRSSWSGPVTVWLSLFRDGELAGESEPITIQADPGSNPRLVHAKVRLNIDKNLLPTYCCEEEWQGDDKFTLRIRTEPAGLRMQARDLRAQIVSRGDANKDLLEDLAQQGSLPALITMLVLFGIACTSSNLSLGHVEEILAVVGLCWVTLFLLAHRIPWLGKGMDAILMGKAANYTGAVICLSLLLLVCGLAYRGTIFAGKSGSEMNRDIERDIAAAPTPEEPIGRQRPRYTVVAILSAIVVGLGIWLLIDDPVPDCALEIVDDFANYDPSILSP